MDKSFEERSNEYIICSAVNYRGDIICGRRHNDCFDVFLRLYNKDDVDFDEVICGFLTSHDKFMDRKEAYVLARKNNQIITDERPPCDINVGDSPPPTDEQLKILISEDLY